MRQPLVSICIPTYNRSEQLKITLDTIINQKEFLEGLVEIVISDNASEDDTEQIGTAYSQRYENVFYYKNEENIRDANFPLAMSRAHGVLRKLNNDTFVFEEDGLKVLCDIAEKYEEKKPIIFLSNGQSKLFVEKCTNFHDFVVDEGYWVTWIASFTMWDSECFELEKDTDGCELSLWQVKKLYELAYKKDDVLICDQKIGHSIAPTKKNVSYGLYHVFYENYLQLLQPYIDSKSISYEDKEKIERKLLYDFFTDWIIMWELGNTDMQYSKTENLKVSVFEQYKGKSYWKRYYFFKYLPIKIRSRLGLFVKKMLGRL